MKGAITIAMPTGIAVAKAVIFDMDGVISDAQTIHARMESDLLLQHGIEMGPDEITHEFAGVSDQEMFPRIFHRFGKRLENLDNLIEYKWEQITKASRGSVRAIPGTLEVIETLRRRGLPLAVASSSRRPFIELILEELNIRESFSAIVSADEVERGKPDPAIFLLAAERLGMPPPSCLVIEDSISSIVAARRAGMLCIGLIPQGSRKDDYPADLLVSDLRHAPLAYSEESLEPSPTSTSANRLAP